MRVRAVAVRILHQIRHDKRTLALMLVAPLLLLTLIYLILDTVEPDFTVGIINAPQSYVNRLEENNISVFRCTASQGLDALKAGEIIATVEVSSGKTYIQIDGSNSTNTTAVLNGLEAAKTGLYKDIRPEMKSDIRYIYGADDLSTFDNFGSVLVGFLIFFFVFLIAGISFLQERTMGTLEKLLSTPIQRWEIVTGYVLGFGAITVVQSMLITFYVVYVLDIMMVGSLWLVMLITLLSAMTALTLGILLSTAASSEFQMIQFIPIVVVPQVFFSGLFELSPGWRLVGKFMPLHYIAHALDEVMIRGNGFSAIAFDVAILLGCSLFFMAANTLLLKRYRKI